MENSWFSHDVTKIQTRKLLLLLSFYFHVIFRAPYNLKTNKFSVQKGSLFCDTGRLNFQALRDAAFGWRPGKLLSGLKTLQIFWRFCYLNIPCLRINIAQKKINIAIPQATNSRISRKTQKQMFLLVFGGHICAPERDTNMASPYKAL